MRLGLHAGRRAAVVGSGSLQLGTRRIACLPAWIPGSPYQAHLASFLPSPTRPNHAEVTATEAREPSVSREVTSKAKAAAASASPAKPAAAAGAAGAPAGGGIQMQALKKDT